MKQILTLALAVLASGAPSRAQMKLPADYREWIFLSSGLGMTYAPVTGATAEHPPFQNVFVSRPAYDNFLRTGQWADKTTFILEIRTSQTNGSINQGGHFQTGIAAVEAEVKENGQWNFYAFGKDGTTAKPLPRTERCYACHAQNGAVDNTFVQFYPTLLPIARAKGTFKVTAETQPAAPLAFAEHTIANDLRSGYHLSIADLNHDGKPDIIALAQGGPDLVWYENPTWERHVLASGLPRMINCAPGDPGPDGIPEIVVAWEFANDASKSLGKVGVLTHDGDPRQPWKLRQIDQIPTAHRIRWADIDGSGKKVVLNAVLTGPKAAPPKYEGDHAPLIMYRPGEWKPELIDNVNEGVQHGILVTRWNRGDKKDSILTASFSGIDLYQYANQYAKKAWTRTEIAKGNSSDVALGYLGDSKFLAAIEPWHGNQVAIYTPKGAGWERKLIDDSLVDGHTIIAADFDGDGRDEVIAGFRQGAKSLYLYRADGAGNWTKQVLDQGGMPGAACAAADLNNDGALDVVCIGGASLKWYENRNR